MIALLISLFSTSGVGAIIGALGGLANRWMDMKSRELDMQDRQAQRTHDLNMRDKDLLVLDREIGGKVQVATVEGAATVEAAAYDALGKSYDNDKATYGIKKVDVIRGLMRPIITFLFMILVCYINYRVWRLLDAENIKLSAEQAFEIIRWTLFEASVVIGWWFASRPTGGAALDIRK